MATSIFDGAMGLRPATECKKFRTLKVAADAAAKIYQNSPVMEASGYAVPYDEDGTSPAVTQMYVACHHVDAAPGEVVDLLVYDDPDMEFYVLGDALFDQAYTSTFMGLIANGAANGADSGTNDNSDALLDIGTSAGAPTAVAPLQVMSLAGVPNNSAAYVAGQTPVVCVKVCAYEYFV